MSTTAIIIVVIAALIVVAALVMFAPNMRAKKYDRELERRRESAADEHRQEAEARAQRAEEAERHAREERERAVHADRKAALHEEGAADHELVREDDDPRLVEHATENGNGRVERTSEQTDVTPDRPRF